MKKIDLDVKTETFFLWEIQFFYTFSEKDKKYFFEKIKDFDLKNFDPEKLLMIFKNILIRENIWNVKFLEKKDIIWLFNFFNSVFL